MQDGVRGSTSGTGKRSQYFLKRLRITCFWDNQRCEMLGKLSHTPPPPVCLRCIVFWSMNYLSTYYAKGKPRLPKKVRIPGGNMSLRKHGTLLNPIGSGAGSVSALCMTSKTLLAKGVCFPHCICKEQSNDEN